MDSSEECRDNRVTNSFILHDLTEASLPFRDNQFDLCTGFGVLKYIPERKIEVLFNEIARVTRRGFFGVGRGIEVPPSDHKGIELRKPADWWLAKFTEIVSGYPVEILSMCGSIISLKNRSPVKEYWRPK